MKINNWIMIRNSKQKDKFELWNAKSGKLYGIDTTTKMLIEQNIEFFKDEESLEAIIALVNNELKVNFNSADYELGENVGTYIVVSKDSINQFIINETVYYLCCILKEKPRTIDEILIDFKDGYNMTDDDIFYILDIIVKLVTYKVLVI